MKNIYLDHLKLSFVQLQTYEVKSQPGLNMNLCALMELPGGMM